MGNQTQPPPPWEASSLGSKLKWQKIARAERKAEGPILASLRPCRQFLCENSVIERGPPLNISVPPARFFKDDKDDEESEEELDVPDEYEHLAEMFIVHKIAHNASSTGRSHNGPHRSRRAMRLKQIQKKAGISRKGFDHESSFAEQTNQSHANQASSPRATAEATSGLPVLVPHVLKGDMGEVEKLISKGTGAINSVDKFGQTALFWAVALPKQSMDMVNLLLSRSATVSVTNKYGYTPLLRALHHGNLPVAKELVRCLADPSDEDKFGGTGLFTAAFHGFAEGVEWLIKEEDCKKHVNKGDADHTTPLMAAARGGHRKVCVLLLEARADPTESDMQGRTPLLFALAREDVYLAQLLIEGRADLHAVDEDGRGILAFLIDNMAKHAEHRDATLCGIVAALEARADVDIQDSKGCTPLFLAAKSDLPMVCAVLATYSADVAATDEQGRCAVTAARKKGQREIVHVLVEFGGVLNHKNVALDKTLMRACYYGDAEAALELIDRGADVKATSVAGQRFKDIAIKQGNAEVVKVLREIELQAEADVKEATQCCMTAPETLEAWRKALGETNERALIVQRAIEMGDAEPCVDVLEAIANSSALTQGAAAADGASVPHLQGHLTFRRSTTKAQAHSGLRILRAAERVQRLDKVMREIKAFMKEARKRAPAELPKIIQRNSGGIRGAHASEYELDDELTRSSEHLQMKLCGSILTKWVEASAVYIEEVATLDMMPKGEHKAPGILDSQCPRCLGVFAHEKGLQVHIEGCRSTNGQERMVAWRTRRNQAGSNVLQTLKGVCQSYSDIEKSAQEFMEDFANESRRAKRKLSDAVPVIMACIAFAQLMNDICSKQRLMVRTFLESEGPKWGFNKEPSAKECVKCGKSAPTRSVFHFKDIDPCRCLCGTCALDMKLKLRAGMPLQCPACGAAAMNCDGPDKVV